MMAAIFWLFEREKHMREELAKKTEAFARDLIQAWTQQIVDNVGAEARPAPRKRRKQISSDVVMAMVGGGLAAAAIEALRKRPRGPRAVARGKTAAKGKRKKEAARPKKRAELPLLEQRILSALGSRKKGLNRTELEAKLAPRKSAGVLRRPLARLVRKRLVKLEGGGNRHRYVVRR